MFFVHDFPQVSVPTSVLAFKDMHHLEVESFVGDCQNSRIPKIQINLEESSLKRNL
jgi:hypothetical protein